MGDTNSNAVSWGFGRMWSSWTMPVRQRNSMRTRESLRSALKYWYVGQRVILDLDRRNACCQAATRLSTIIIYLQDLDLSLSMT